MIIKPVYLEVNDLMPYYGVTAFKSDGSGVKDLTGATIKVTMTNKETGEVKFVDQDATPVDLALGKFRYEWQLGDTDTIGTFIIKFRITPALPETPFTLPNPEFGCAEVIISEC